MKTLGTTTRTPARIREELADVLSEIDRKEQELITLRVEKRALEDEWNASVRPAPEFLREMRKT